MVFAATIPYIEYNLTHRIPRTLSHDVSPSSRLVYLLMVLFFPVSFPIAKLLDCLLGSDHATFFRRAELKALVSLHGPDAEEQPEDEAEKLTMDEVLIIKVSSRHLETLSKHS